jgi:hypothetical protein
MAQSKLNDLAGRFAKGPKGVGTGLKILAAAGAAGYGVVQSLYTGKSRCVVIKYASLCFSCKTHEMCFMTTSAIFVDIPNLFEIRSYYVASATVLKHPHTECMYSSRIEKMISS